MNSKKLYHFLMNNECHLFRRKNNIVAWVSVNFFDIKDFVEIIGSGYFDEGGFEVQLLRDYIAVEINDIIDNNGEELGEYKKCFGDEWNKYFNEDGSIID